MKRLLYGLVLLALVSASSSRLNAQNVLPDSFGAWKSSSEMVDIGRTANPSEDVLKEAGQARVEGRHYIRSDRKLAVLAEEFHDPTGAYQVYTARLSTKLNPSTVAPLTAAGNDQLIALVGNRVVTVSGIRSASDADLKLLLDQLQQSSDRSPLPPIRGYLPDVDMVQGSQK